MNDESNVNRNPKRQRGEWKSVDLSFSKLYGLKRTTGTAAPPGLCSSLNLSAFCITNGNSKGLATFRFHFLFTAYASFGDVFVYFLVPKLLLGYPYP